MLGAVDSRGGIYNACTNTNTDSSVIIVFFDHLHEMLKRTYPDEVEKIVYLLDGAGYHKSKETRHFMERKGMQVILLGPYSYLVSV